MKKLCIFDFDGTLFDSITDVVNCFNQTFIDLGYETLNLEQYKNSLGGNIDEILALILKENNNEENIELVMKTYEQLYSKDKKENTHLYPGTYKLLRQLQKEGFILAINSNRKPNSINYFINLYLSDIDFIDIQGHVPNHPSKPDVYGVNTILEKAGVEKEDCVYIGDSITDIRTAMNAQIDCILVNWGYGVGDVYDNEYPVAVVDNAEDILKLVKKE